MVLDPCPFVYELGRSSRKTYCGALGDARAVTAAAGWRRWRSPCSRDLPGSGLVPRRWPPLPTVAAARVAGRLAEEARSRAQAPAAPGRLHCGRGSAQAFLRRAGSPASSVPGQRALPSGIPCSAPVAPQGFVGTLRPGLGGLASTSPQRRLSSGAPLGPQGRLSVGMASSGRLSFPRPRPAPRSAPTPTGTPRRPLLGRPTSPASPPTPRLPPSPPLQAASPEPRPFPPSPAHATAFPPSPASPHARPRARPRPSTECRQTRRRGGCRDAPKMAGRPGSRPARGPAAHSSPRR